MDKDKRPRLTVCKRWLPLLAVIAGIMLVWYYRLDQYVTFDYLAAKHHQLQRWKDDYYLLTVAAYMLIYALAVAISMPGAALLTLLGGYLFGLTLGPLYVIVSATAGASAIFTIVRLSVGEFLARGARAWYDKLKTGIQQNAFYYILSLRLIPIVPFWVLNIVPALFNVRFLPFMLATLIGITPGAIIYASLGNGLGSLFEQGKRPELSILLEPQLLLPLVGLAISSLLPVVYKHYQRTKG